MFSELQILEAKTRELEVKKERMLGLEYESHRLATEALFEKEKCVALIHEFSIQRNVHRWDAIAAVDPTYVKHIRYHGLLVSKIDASHRELIRLTKVRDDLRAQADRLAVTGTGKLTRQQVADHIQKYKNDIAEKDAQIEELARQVSGNTPSMHNSLQGIEDVRLKVVSRHGTAARLRTRSVLTMNQTRDPAWFMTEVPVDRYRGGGYVAKGTQGTAPTNGDTIELPAVAQKRAKTSLLNSNSKKVTKPTNQGEVRSPVRPILPPLAEASTV